MLNSIHFCANIISMNFGQCLFMGIAGTELTSEEERFIIENNIGGIVLFARNLESPEQIWELNRKIQRLRIKQADQAPLFVAVDMEGGRVHRLKAPFTKWPAVAHIGNIDSPTVAFQFAHAMGNELRAVGFNMDFAPCVDVLTNPENPVIGDRSPSSDPEVVAKIGSALVRGYIKAGVIACAKHFPGHGNSSVDSHEELPVDPSTMERLDQVEMIPFKKVFKSRLDMVMTCHMQFPNVDDVPVTLSEKFITQLLRETCRYRGLVITDDLDMRALRNHFSVSEIPVRALQAGCDILLYCNEPDSPPTAIESISKAIESGQLDKAVLEERAQRVLKLKMSKLSNQDTMPLEDALEVINNQKHKDLAAAIKEESVPESLLDSLSKAT